MLAAVEVLLRNASDHVPLRQPHPQVHVLQNSSVVYTLVFEPDAVRGVPTTWDSILVKKWSGRIRDLRVSRFRNMLRS
jgi:hypothetical protein